ncbi:MAG: hypothetical protein H0T62_05320 [Parachlamydiaceae bacterium]|nr:hypothetical protein [Parachlamydiaceae bacterium]
MISSIQHGISTAAEITGYIPIVCFFSGLMKAVYGVAKVIFNSIKASYEDKIHLAKFNEEKERGWQHLKAGGLEVLHLKFLAALLCGCFCCCLGGLLSEKNLNKHGILI